MTKLSSDRAAVVDPEYHYRPIDADTPQGVLLILISRPLGSAMIGRLPLGRGYFTHWSPMPTFKKETHALPGLRNS